MGDEWTCATSPPVRNEAEHRRSDTDDDDADRERDVQRDHAPTIVGDRGLLVLGQLRLPLACAGIRGSAAAGGLKGGARVGAVSSEHSRITVCVPVGASGLLDPRWGRADRVAVTTVDEDGIGDWQEFEVGWSNLREAGTEGSHHARIATFLRDHKVEAVVADHMGPPMAHMLGKMGITVRLGAKGDARAAALSALGGGQSASD